jgi:hypothetical protein
VCCAQALVDSPTETRRVVGFKRLALTDLKLDIKRVPGKTELTKAFTEAGEAAKQRWHSGSGSSEAAPGQQLQASWPAARRLGTGQRPGDVKMHKGRGA